MPIWDLGVMYPVWYLYLLIIISIIIVVVIIMGLQPTLPLIVQLLELSIRKWKTLNLSHLQPEGIQIHICFPGECHNHPSIEQTVWASSTSPEVTPV